MYWGYDLGNLTPTPEWLTRVPESWDEEYARRKGWAEVPFPRHLPWPHAPTPYQQYAGSNPHESVIKQHRIWVTAYETKLDELQRSPEWLAWRANRDEMRSLAGMSPVDISAYGGGENFDCSPRDVGWCVRVRASVQDTDTSTKLRSTDVGHAWAEQVRQFMVLLDLPVPDGDGPAWHLNVSYG